MFEQEKSYSQVRREFYEKYNGKIVPFVRMHEDSRKKKLYTAIITTSVLVIIALILLYFGATANLSRGGQKGLTHIICWLFILAIILPIGIKKSFENNIKKRIMPIVCSCFGNMKWSQGSYSYGELFVSSFVVPEYTSADYDDIFEGSYSNVNIEIVESEYIRGSGKNSKTVFDGVIVKLDMNKSFSGHTIIKPNSFMHIPPSKELHHTELEDSEFNRRFDVFTNDEIDARYLITPSFMERLKGLKTAFSASSVSCAFFENLLIVALPTNKDLFSICSLIKPIDDSKQYFQMYEEIVSIIKLIDHFKLNQKIGI